MKTVTDATRALKYIKGEGACAKQSAAAPPLGGESGEPPGGIEIEVQEDLDSPTQSEAGEGHNLRGRSEDGMQRALHIKHVCERHGIYTTYKAHDM